MEGKAVPKRLGKVSFLVVCLLMLVSSVGVASEGIELVENGSFEIVNDKGEAVGFQFWLANGDVEIVVTDEASRTGKNSVRISGTDKPRGSVTFRGDVTGGETYRFQVWYRYDIDGPWETPSGFPWMGHHVLMRLMVYNKDGKIPFSDAWIVDPNEGWYDVRENMHVLPAPWEFGDPNEWALFSTTIKMPEDAIRVEVNLFNWFGEGKVYFDDLSVVKL